VLKTISLPQAAPGVVSATWDGRSDGGRRVAPGIYTVTVTVIDSAGQKASGEILTRLDD
jgi:flagellar hook assembly protein FlgD